MEIIAASYILPVSSPPVEGGALLVDGGRIRDVGKLSDLRSRHSVPVREFPGCAIIPGFVNAHTHLELTHFPSWKIRKGIDYSPRTYVDWVIQVIKIGRGLTRKERESSLREGIRISLESGTTAVGDILSDGSFLPVYEGTPLTGRVYLEAIGQDPLRCTSLHAKLESELKLFTGLGMHPGLSPHAPHTLSEAFMRQIGSLAAEKSLPMAIHLAESREESEFLFDSTGKIAELLYPHVGWRDYLPPPRRSTPVEYLDRLGILQASPKAAHCVHVSGADAELLKKRGVRVVLCPRSNERLDVGKAPAALFKKMGIPLALGTDSLASNDSLSMQDEMGYLSSSFTGVFTPSEILHMATLGGATALGLVHDTGSLEEGKRADFLVLDLEGVRSADDVPAAIPEARLLEVASAGEFLSSRVFP